MSSFQRLFEAVSYMQSSSEDKAVELYLKHDANFWSNLANIANNNPDALANMLGLKVESVMGWYKKIKTVAEKADKLKAEKVKNQMLPTGTEKGE